MAERGWLTQAGLLNMLGRYISALAVLASLLLVLAIIALLYGEASMGRRPSEISASSVPSAKDLENRIKEVVASPSKDRPRKALPKGPVPTQQQKNLAAFATLVDPGKTREYFMAYSAADRSTKSCGRGGRVAYSRGLADAFAKLAPKAREAGYARVIGAYCGLWREANSQRNEILREVAQSRRTGRRIREQSLIAIAAALGFLAVLTLPLALVMIARNTKALTDLVDAIGRGDRGPIPVFLIAFMASALIMGDARAQAPPGAGSAPALITEQELKQQQAQEKRRKALAQRRKHVGQNYVFQPKWITKSRYGSRKGKVREVFASQWFYRAPFTLWSTPPKDRFKPLRSTRFTVLDLDSLACYQSSYTQRRKRAPQRCYFYKVDLGGGLTAYLEAGRISDKALAGKFAGKNALAFISRTSRGSILADFPEVLERREIEMRKRKAREQALAQKARQQKQLERAARLRTDRERRIREARIRREAEAAARKSRIERARELRLHTARERDRKRREARIRFQKEQKEKRLEARRARLSKRFPEAWVDGILKKNVELNWKLDAVRESWGRPKKIVRVPPSDELWQYRGKHVIFSSGAVRAVVIEEPPAETKVPKR